MSARTKIFTDARTDHYSAWPDERLLVASYDAQTDSVQSEERPVIGWAVEPPESDGARLIVPILCAPLAENERWGIITPDGRLRMPGRHGYASRADFLAALKLWGREAAGQR